MHGPMTSTSGSSEDRYATCQTLYGHPDAGTMWEQHCDTHVREVWVHASRGGMAFNVPVVPHKAVAEVSKIGNL